MRNLWITGVHLFAAMISISAHCDEPVRTTVCEIQKNPPAYNHKLVELQAFVSWGFEDFTIFDPECYTYPQIWLEYGGNLKSDTVYCCGPTAGKSRPKDLQVEGIEIPLLTDESFRKFDERIHRRGPREHGPITRATLIGRYFAGRKEKYPSGESWTGFGHFGCCTLLAIQQVREVSAEETGGLDPYSLPMPMIAGLHQKTIAYRFLIPEDVGKFMIESQRLADSGIPTWAFDNPRKTALELIRNDSKRKDLDETLLLERYTSTGTIQYEFKTVNPRRTYDITVTKPYWLSFYARNPRRVAWIVENATVSPK